VSVLGGEESMAPSAQSLLRVLLVSPGDQTAQATIALLESLDPPPHRVRRVVDVPAALAAMAQAEFDAVLLDVVDERELGHGVVAGLREQGFGGAFLVLAPGGDRSSDLASMHAGAADFLVREQTDAPRLERSLRYAVEHARVRAELQRSNAELERFAAAVSHDLRQPLHLVAGYAELLEVCCPGPLGSDAQHALRQIRFGTERMNDLIEDMLVYARSGRGRHRLEAVDTSFVLEVVERELSDRVRASGAVIEKGLLPVVQGYRPLIEQLLRNLVGNAIKFCCTCSPRIFVGAESRGDDWLFWVRDNGPGIPAAYQDCLFEMFTRGPQRDEVEGTGIGLAVCKKAVQDHGGRIWVESTQGQGATFWFTLPRRNGRS
jgi:signal transduction histidine kinase